jgi:tetratricopeptide (TPR) repeat protein
MDLGRRLRSLRLERGLTQSDLAQPRFTGAYVSTIESGRRTPSADALEHFATKLAVDPEQLKTGRPPGLEVALQIELEDARRLASRGDLKEAEGAYDRIHRRAKRFDLIRIRGLAEEGRAICAERSGDAEEAIEHCEKALDTLRSEPPTIKAPITARLARCLHMRGESRYAIVLVENLLDELERQELRDPLALVSLYGPLVVLKFDSGLYKQADEIAERALRLSSGVTEPVALATMYVNVARVQLHKGHYEDAESSLNRAEALFRDADLQTEMGVAHLAHGFVLARKDEPESARGQFELALQIFIETRSPINEAHTRNELARLERLSGSPERARELLQRSLDLAGDVGDLRVLAWAHRELGLCMQETDPLAAEKNLRHAIDLYERAEEKLELAITYGDLGNLFDAQGDQTGSCEALRTGIEVIRTMM